MVTINSSDASPLTAPQNVLQWEIWDVEWEHEDGTSKARPALVVSSTAFNAGNDAIWFAKISTKEHDVPHRLELATSDPAFSRTGLAAHSYFYLANVRQITRSKIYRRGACWAHFRH